MTAAKQYRHLAELIFRQAEKYHNRSAILFRNTGARWQKITWNGFAASVRLSSQAMIELGIGIQENIGVCSQNMPECFFTDFGAYGIRAVPVPMYATSSPAQIEYIVRDAGIRFLFVGEQLQYDNALQVQQKMAGGLERLIIFDPSVVRHPGDAASIYFEDFLRLGNHAAAETAAKIRRSQAVPEDLAVIVYTSGTTGEPKGVMLTHANFLALLRIHDIRLPEVNDRDLSMCFLPLTHIFEKAWSCYCFHKGVEVAVNRDPKKIQHTLPEIRPTLMCNVPHFWEKVYAGTHAKIAGFPPLIQKIIRRAVRTGRKYNLDCKRTGTTPPLILRLEFACYDKTVFSLLKKVTGLKRGRVFPVAGALLSDHIAEFLLSVNFPIRYGYGLSETSATVCFYPKVNYQLGSIGTVMPDLQVRIDPLNHEILVKGATVMSGYYKKPEETAAAFTEDGFFRTGDAGRLEGDTVYFLERIKDLYKTSNGKYIAPQAIETSLTGNVYIEQCAVIANERKFASALIVPAFPALAAFAEKEGITYQSLEELIANEEIIRLYASGIEACQKDFTSYEQIKCFTLLPRPFTIETGELTDTLKLRRPVILKKYAAAIDKMYEAAR
ncbi:MAG: long-chain fatty acid--CoA ligase [Tannerella sp.]|jgi:long-chain acyl-CoA synthetase|nr:long-chain fatty acid--CoA ligase [Tannerella sp.]